MKAIYKRELQSYFKTTTGYVFVAFMLLAIGIYSVAINIKSGSANFEYVLYNMSFIYLLIIPLLTMRSFSEEKRQKTDQMLYSAPIKISGIVLGKYLAMLTVLAVPILITAFYPLILSAFGTVNLLISYSALIVFFFLGATLISVGMLISAYTENPLISAVVTFCAMLLIYLSTGITSFVSTSTIATLIAFTILVILAALIVGRVTKSKPAAFLSGIVLEVILLVVYLIDQTLFESGFTKVLNAIAIFQRFDVFMYGVFNINSFFYFITVSALFVFLSVQAVEKRRWS